ncbi:MAG: NADH-quinone oxidoreductase subunit L [Chloroflexi bacterium]|nr:NADH-quinone oxidoreductase subunit L [Chloroflexota bacterium]MBK6711085.1 NADH-quinone oxidoreductase subunit L [Chloroflexota bacterium]MBK7178016.1 NADH-quinone oxidoreductase subunit L [Chloroflexota bacterium]
MNAYSLAPLLLLFPAIGVLFNGLIGRRFVEADAKVGERWSGWFASLMAIGSFVIAVLLFLSLQANEFQAMIVPIIDWISIPSANFYIPWAIRVDTLSVTMMLVVTGVGSLIHIYAIGYMHGDPNFSRFFTYFSLFIFFMLILVSGSTYLVLFVGWEGVGLCSFLLISFWFDRTNAAGKAMNADAGRKAFIVNRVGDFGMILAMFLMFWAFRSLEFGAVFNTAVEMFEQGHVVEFGLFSAPIGTVLTAITALFLLGATGKSAQIPLYVWLPDAMAGPTPVSALIHAATMVTSGIYLIVRSNVLFELARESGPVIFGVISTPDLVAYVGAFTGLLAGLIAFTQFDIKKVLAYSTVSQLGFMIAAAGMGAYVAAMFHLVTHAFFKALLFLGSGSVIHGMEHGHHHLHEHTHDDHHGDGHHEEAPFDPQDMRTMGGLRHKMPTTFWVYLVGALALSGIPPLAGFWSKDEILAHGNEHALVVYVILAIAAVCTAFYMGRQLHMTFFGEPRHAAAEHAQESPRLMTTPLIVLAGLAIVGGLLNLPYLTQAMAEANHNHPAGIFLGLEGWLEHSIKSFELSEEGILHLPHTPIVLSPVVAGISTLLAVLALGGAFYVYRNKPETAADPDPLQKLKPLWWFRILPFETFYMKFIVPPFNWLANWLAFAVDWNFWHDFVHNNLIRDMFVSFATFLADVFDKFGVDGTVNGIGSVTKGLAGGIRRTQTGFARTYALGVFLGAVALLAYFLWVLY